MISDIRIIKAVRVRVRATGACVNREKVRVRAPGACVLWSKMSEDFLSARFRAEMPRVGLITHTMCVTRQEDGDDLWAVGSHIQSNRTQNSRPPSRT